RLGSWIELAHDAHRPPGASGSEELPLEHFDPTNSESRQMESDRDTGHAATNEDRVGRLRGHGIRPLRARGRSGRGMSIPYLARLRTGSAIGSSGIVRARAPTPLWPPRASGNAPPTRWAA